MAAILSSYCCNIRLPPSCIEFVPDHASYLLIGTYSLLQPGATTEAGDGSQSHTTAQAQDREGNIVLMSLADNQLSQLDTIRLDHGVLDLHFSPLIENAFCTANSTSSISIYSFIPSIGNNSPRIESICTINPVVEECLVLAVAWHPTKSSILGATLSNGRVILLEALDCFLQPEPDIIVSIVVHHELEAWTLSFSPYSDSLFSGADDCVISSTELIYDPMFDPSQTVTSENLWKDRKIHGAGVTAILPLDDEIILTGSYDDHIRVLSLLSISTGAQRPKVVAETNLGGGVWRLKLLKKDELASKFLILASCMHAGARILRISRTQGQTNWTIEVLARFEEHRSMNYGSDSLIQGESIIVVSTSFYDKLVCLWTVTDGV
jgi:diphthine methyl ester acylhydrolase